MNTTEWIQNGGLLLVCLLVFCSTGLFVCFFLPVGAVLFTTGVLFASGGLQQDPVTVLLALSFSAVAGNTAGYALGRRIGPALYAKKDTWYFRRKHLLAAEKFYQRYGGWAISGGFFLPVIRSFSPVIAGLVRLPFSRLLGFSVVGSVAWVVSFAGAGLLIGSCPLLRPYLPWLVGVFILVVTVPILLRIIRAFRKEQT
jgi:membrane-associated protein